MTEQDEGGRMKVSAFLILSKTKKNGRAMRVARVTQTRPALAADEAMIQLQLDVPDDIFDAPLVTIPVEKRNVGVGVEVEEIAEP